MAYSLDRYPIPQTHSPNSIPYFRNPFPHSPNPIPQNHFLNSFPMPQTHSPNPIPNPIFIPQTYSSVNQLFKLLNEKQTQKKSDLELPHHLPWAYWDYNWDYDKVIRWLYL